MEKNRSTSFISNFLWRFAERCGAQGVSLIVSIVLARVLLPEMYGVVALVTVFTSILQVFVDSGLGTALIQKKDADDVDFSSVFYFNMFVCGILYLGMFLASPLIAEFYNNYQLVSVIRVMSLTLVISGLKNVQQAYVSRNLLFKKFFFSTIAGTIIAAVAGIIAALNGLGVWALVIQNLTNKIIDTAVLWFTVNWHPKLLFSWKQLKGLLSFGWKILVASLIDTIFNNIRQLVIGKIYSPSDLAFYNRGKQFPELIATNAVTATDSVLLPTLSKEQENRNRIKQMTQRSIKTSVYIMAPLMMGMAFIGEPFIRLILTDKWSTSVFYLRVFCIEYMFYTIHTANLNSIKALGRSDTFLRLEILKKIVGLVVLVCTMRISVKVMALSQLAVSIISQIINSWPNRKLLNYGYLQQIQDISPSIVLSLIMGVIIYPFKYLPISDLCIVGLQVTIGAIIYIICSIVTKNESFVYLFNIVQGIVKQRR